MLGYGLPRLARTTWEALADSIRKGVHICGVELRAALSGTTPGSFARCGVRETLALRSLQCCFFNQHALPFVALSAATEAHDDGVQR